MRLVYFSPVPWASFAQRPHRFVEWFHRRTKGEVLWVEPYPTRLPNLTDWRSHPQSGVCSPTVPDWLSVARVKALPVEPVPILNMFNEGLWLSAVERVESFAASKPCLIGIGKPSRLALHVLVRIKGCVSFFDAMDDFPCFYTGLSRHSMSATTKGVAARVDRIIVSSSYLRDLFAGHRDKVVVALNACSLDAPPRHRTGAGDHPVFGYVGTIGHWFDWLLTVAIAESWPDAYVRLVGPVHSAPPGALPPNVQLLPPQEHADAMLTMSGFDVGIIPFLQVDITAGVDPIKYYEYRALGLPVVSTAFGEMALRGGLPGVFLVNRAANLRASMDLAMSYRDAPEMIADFRADNTWDARFDASGLLDAVR